MKVAILTVLAMLGTVTSAQAAVVNCVETENKYIPTQIKFNLFSDEEPEVHVFTRTDPDGLVLHYTQINKVVGSDGGFTDQVIYDFKLSHPDYKLQFTKTTVFNRAGTTKKYAAKLDHGDDTVYFKCHVEEK
ncbi:MAG: hypothetical protein AB7F66_09255 [Bacteriovoracia bacterium]